ncbi:hypothetical protein JCM17845_03740 [Iodidimonas gelatinilytica]|uniref:Uncharacterized protein n=1 Tax=Iodidimonas gelatinilytica TaxID=1236966 RepID=A0A5A7MUR7_9PROT|nr:hypothetical protein JCM17845_03740 [Iodidimonas gelatinilytica]
MLRERKATRAILKADKIFDLETIVIARKIMQYQRYSRSVLWTQPYIAKHRKKTTRRNIYEPFLACKAHTLQLSEVGYFYGSDTRGPSTSYEKVR